MKWLALSVLVCLTGCAGRHYAVCMQDESGVGCSKFNLSKKEAIKFGKILSAATGNDVGIAKPNPEHRVESLPAEPERAAPPQKTDKI